MWIPKNDGHRQRRDGGKYDQARSRILRTKIVHCFGIVTNKDVSAVALGSESHGNLCKVFAMMA